MVNHIGEVVKIADPYTRGLINDHVSVQPHWDIMRTTYCVYVRSDYCVGNGPEPIPQAKLRNERLEQIPQDDLRNSILEQREGQKLRGWGKISDVCKDVSLEEALMVATLEAQKRNLFLYLERSDSKYEIRWHPDGWKPVQG
jgi:hypothetical protein